MDSQSKRYQSELRRTNCLEGYCGSVTSPKLGTITEEKLNKNASLLVPSRCNSFHSDAYDGSCDGLSILGDGEYVAQIG